MDEDIKPDIRTHFRPYSEERKSKVDGCWDPDGCGFNIVRDIGEIWRNPLECNRKTCSKDGTIIEEVCPDPVVPEGCVRIKGFNTEYQDFPYCCDRVACPGDEEYWEDDPEWPQKCEDKYCLRDIGEQWSEHKYGICNRKRCGRDKYNEAEIFEETCPEVDVPKGCELEAYPNLTKEFPDCCPRVVCPPGHPANKSDGRSDGETVTHAQTGLSGNGDNQKSFDKHDGSDNTGKSGKDDKRIVGIESHQRINKDTNLIHRREESWNHYNRNIYEMFRSFYTREEKKEDNRTPTSSSQNNTDKTAKIERTRKHKKKIKNQRKNDSGYEKKKIKTVKEANVRNERNILNTQ